MSLVRPELAARLRPWREALVWAAAAALGAWLLLSGLAAGALLPSALGVVLAGAGGGLLVAALRRRRLAAQPPAEGVVAVDEGRVAYFGPRSGGFIDLEGLERVEIVTDGRSAAWQLLGEGGARLRVPVGALGAERLYDALAGHAALDQEALKAGLASPRPARFPVWVRP